MSTIEAVIKTIATKLDDSDCEIKSKAISSLISICNDSLSCQEILISLFKSEKNSSIKTSILKILEKIGLQETIPFLVEICEDKDDDLRLHAVEALGEVAVRTKNFPNFL